MTERVTNELLFETLKQIQGRLSGHDQQFSRIENELRAIETHLVGLC